VANGQQLEGWGAIAAYLGVAVRTSQNYERDYALPVRRMPGVRGRVFADSNDLESWKAALGGRVENMAAAESVSGPESTDSREAETAAKPPARASRSRIYAAAVVVAILGAVSWAVWDRLRPPRIPAGIDTIANTLIVKDVERRELWRHVFPWPLDPLYRTPYEAGRFWFASDIDGDGETEVVFGYYPETLPENEDSRLHEVFCFSQDGKRIKWLFRVGRPKITALNGVDYFPPYWIGNVKLVPGRPPHRARIVVSSIHHIEYPNQVVVLDGQGKLTGEYWHPGHLTNMGFADLDGDGKQKLLLAGVNNAEHAATLLVFDPDKVGGTPQELAEPQSGFQGMPRGTDLATVFFPRTCLALAGPKQEAYNRVTNLIVTKERLQVQVSLGTNPVDARANLYDLDYDLRVRSIEARSAFLQAHRELEHAGILKHSLYPDEIRQIAERVIVKRRPGGAQQASKQVR